MNIYDLWFLLAPREANVSSARLQCNLEALVPQKIVMQPNQCVYVRGAPGQNLVRNTTA